jgi:hypothetical protein
MLVPRSAEKTLNVAVVYHDLQTHAWAAEVFDRVRKSAGKATIRGTWWKISDLIEPGVLAGAVSTAMRADVILVAVDAEERLPLPFHVWVDTWLPNRLQMGGSLVALLGRREALHGHPSTAENYLRAVAREGRFDFVLEQRRLSKHTATAPQQWAPALRSNLEPVHMRALVSVGHRVSHRAA